MANMANRDETKINFQLALEGLEELYFENYSWGYARKELGQLISRAEILLLDYEDLRKNMRKVLAGEAAKEALFK